MFATHKWHTLHRFQSKIDIKFDDIHCDFVCHTFSSISLLFGQANYLKCECKTVTKLNWNFGSTSWKRSPLICWKCVLAIDNKLKCKHWTLSINYKGLMSQFFPKRSINFELPLLVYTITLNIEYNRIGPSRCLQW